MNRRFFLGLSLLAVLALPFSTYAAGNPFTTPIVPTACNCINQLDPSTGQMTLTTAPDYGCVLQVIQNVINLAVYLGVLITIIYIVVAGAQMVINSTNPSAIKTARGRIWNGVIGISLILCSWLIVDFVMKTLYNSTTYGPWNGILADNGNHTCIVAKIPTGIPTTITGAISQFANPGTGSSVAGGGTKGPSTATGNEADVRTQLAAAGISVNKSACPAGATFESVSGGCTTVGGFQQNTIQQVIEVKKICGSVQVTGGNELGHKGGSVSHSSGYKVDLAANIDSCIQGGSGGYFSRNGSRGSDPEYADKCGNSYVRESSPAHWDITVGKTCIK
jgi:hypothetical protein